MQDRVVAEGLVTGRAGEIDATLGLEPLPLLVDQGHESDWNSEERLCQLRDAVEGRLRGCSKELQTVQRFQAGGLVDEWESQQAQSFVFSDAYQAEDRIGSLLPHMSSQPICTQGSGKLVAHELQLQAALGA